MKPKFKVGDIVHKTFSTNNKLLLHILKVDDTRLEYYWEKRDSGRKGWTSIKFIDARFYRFSFIDYNQYWAKLNET